MSRRGLSKSLTKDRCEAGTLSPCAERILLLTRYLVKIRLDPHLLSHSEQVGMLRRRVFSMFLLLAPLGARTHQLQGQSSDTRRVEATRAELEAQLIELDKVVNSPGYSGRLRAAKRAEADLVRQRLTDGDLQVGDRINLTVVGEAALTDSFVVAPGRVLILPGIPEVPVKGVLRSEFSEHLTEHLKKYIRDPQVHAQTLIRLSIFGAVGRPGFYQVPAEQLASDAIMQSAGGPTGNADTHKTTVKRNGVEIWSEDAFQEALVQGVTLDMLNLRAGDEIVVGVKKHFNLRNVLFVIPVTTSFVFLLTRIGIL
jgi:protein involved in polysaccharide export with SLBB domain